jgi:hypothetical protein
MMPRIAIAVSLAALAVHSADGATMKGTLTLDDGRVMTLAVGRFHQRGSRNVTIRIARLWCHGDACFAPRGNAGYVLPLPSGFGVEFGDRYFSTPAVACGTPPTRVLRPGCHIHEAVTCSSFTTAAGYVPVAAGTLDLRRVAPECRRSLHQVRR